MKGKCLLYLVLVIVVPLMMQGQGKRKALPNIVFILADDLGYGDLGAYGQKLIRTPHIDRLAKEGMRFTNFYAGSTVCAPSRASLMTGQHTGRTYIRGNGELALRAGDSILPQQLKQRGYVNGMVGKWGLGLQGTTGAPELKGWDFFVGHLHHVEGHYQQADSVWQLVGGNSKKVGFKPHTYANELFARAANDFIRQNRKQPFFLYVAFTLPHAELKVPARYLRQYQHKNGESIFAPEKAYPAGQHYGKQLQPKAAYAAMVSSMDDYIGTIMHQLKRYGLEKNTIVIFASDNGTHIEGGRSLQDALEVFQSSGALRGTKRDLYEGGIRVPFIVSWPGQVAAATRSDQPGAFWDVVPTIGEITGTQPAAADGTSFLPTLLGRPQSAQSRSLYWEFYEGGFKQAVRHGDWKAIRFYKDAKPLYTELYHLALDVGEKNDLATKHPEKVRELEALMDKAHLPSQSKLFQVR